MKIFLALSSILFVFIHTGCGSSGSSQSDTKSRRVTIAYGGGFSGEIKGFTLAGSGKVSSWSRMPGNEAVVTDLFTTTPDDAAFFFRYLDEISFTSKKFSTTGNMTTSIESDSADLRHTVKWGIESANVPCEFSNFYSMLKNYIERRSRK